MYKERYKERIQDKIVSLRRKINTKIENRFKNRKKVFRSDHVTHYTKIKFLSSKNLNSILRHINFLTKLKTKIK